MGHAFHLGPQFSTFLTYRSATSPDIILGKSKIFQNTLISPNKILASSDHNYIVFTISTSLIQISIIEKDSIRSGNWEKYNKTLSSKPIYIQPQISNDELVRLTNSWTVRVSPKLSSKPCHISKLLSRIDCHKRNTVHKWQKLQDMGLITTISQD